MNKNGYDAASLVCLPRYEYARLVAAKAKLDMVERVMNGMEIYAVKDVLKLLLTEEDAGE